MTRIAVLLPYKDMAEMARRVIDENHDRIEYVKVIESENAVNEARIAAEQGADIIIARGYQAQLIKNYTNIPVVEMRFHAQEIGLLIQRAKKLSRKERPVIGLAAFENMLCDLSRMEELFGVRLLISYIDRIEEVPDILHDMRREGTDCVIGGDTVCQEAEKIGCYSVKFTATEESVRDAMERAKSMAYAVENEKRNTAQFETSWIHHSTGSLRSILMAGSLPSTGWWRICLGRIWKRSKGRCYMTSSRRSTSGWWMRS